VKKSPFKHNMIIRINVQNKETTIFKNMTEATNNTLNAEWHKVRKAYKQNKEYLGYMWVGEERSSFNSNS
jgi:hypothetical protein